MAWDVDDSTGLLGHYIGTITNSKWTTDSQKSDPNAPFLLWNVEVHDILQENFQGEVPADTKVQITIGKGWVEDEDGVTVEHKEGLEMFKSSSAYGKIISLVSGKSENYGNNAVVLDGDGPVAIDFKPVAKHMADKGFDDPRNSKIWEGLTFEFRGIGFKYKNADNDPYMLTLPVRLADPSGTTAAEVKQEAAARNYVNTQEIWTAAGATPDVAETLDELANAAKTHTAFMKDALLLPEVKESETLSAAVKDKATYENHPF